MLLKAALTVQKATQADTVTLVKLEPMEQTVLEIARLTKLALDMDGAILFKGLGLVIALRVGLVHHARLCSMVV
jgi:hypothetical protein